MQQQNRRHHHRALWYYDVLGLIFYSYEYTLSPLSPRSSCLPVRRPYFGIPVLHQLWVVSELRLEAFEPITKNHDFVGNVFALGL